MRTNQRLPYISKQLTIAISIVMVLGMLPMLWLFVDNQEREIMASNEDAMTKVTQSIIDNLDSIMVAGYADIAHSYALGLKAIPSISHVAITRVDGSEAFLDNMTIDSVNAMTGDDSFYPRSNEDFYQVIKPNDKHLREVINTQSIVKFYEEVNGESRLTFLAPIINQERCQTCHGDDHSIRGILKVSTSQSITDAIADKNRTNTIVIFVISIIAITLAALYNIFETLINPLNTLTGTMRRVADGFLHLRAPVNGHDELTEIARNFNVMIHRIERSNEALDQERTKLLAIVQTNQEGVICTDTTGHIVLANPSAGYILGVSADSLIGKSFDDCLGSKDEISSWFSHLPNGMDTRIQKYNQKTLSVAANLLSDESGLLIGRSLRFEDITSELEAKKRLEMLSTIDPLTGLYNRHYFNVSISHEITRSVIDSEPLNLLMIDIDFFKKVNDTHGHDAGDAVLVETANIITKLIRANDVACRFGGEEFIVLLPETPMSGAIILAERIRREIETAVISGIKITVSIGIADLKQTNNNDQDELTRLADEQLYIAKQSGRNQVRFNKVGTDAE